MPAMNDVSGAARPARLLQDRDVKAILGAFPVAFVVYEADSFRIAEANDAATRMFVAPSLAGRDVRELMLDLDEPGVTADGFPVPPMEPGAFVSADGRPMLRTDGAVVHVDCLVGDAVVGGTCFRMLALRDVSERVEHERARDQAAHDLMRHQLLFRREVAERLHDGPVQVLTAASLRLGLLRFTAGPELHDEIAEIERLVSQSLRDVRVEMEDLRPPINISEDLTAALEDLLVRIGVDHRFVVRCGPVDPPDSIGQLFFKVVQHLVLADLDAEDAGTPTIVDVSVSARECRLRMRTAGDGQLTDRLASWAMTLHGTITRTSDAAGTTFTLAVPIPRVMPGA